MRHAHCSLLLQNEYNRIFNEHFECHRKRCLLRFQYTFRRKLLFSEISDGLDSQLALLLLVAVAVESSEVTNQVKSIEIGKII